MMGDVARTISQVVESRDSKHVRSGEQASVLVVVVELNNCLAGLDIVGHCGSQSSVLSTEEICPRRPHRGGVAN